MTHYGVDLSQYQGDIDCTGWKAAGIDFAYVKVSEGGDIRNGDAIQQCAALRAAGIKVGYYHFVDTAPSVSDQFTNFSLYAMALGTPDLPTALDVESPDPAGWPALGNLVVNLALRIESWHPRQCILYVNGSFYGALPGFPWGRTVWYADPGAPAPNRPCLIWQKGYRAVPGLPVVDSDQFMGTEAQWAAFSQTPTIAPPVIVSAPQPPGASMPVTPALNYRPGQYDFFQVESGTLWHHWHLLGVWEKESLQVATGQGGLAPTLQGQPAASVVGGVCVVVAEDTNGNAWIFQQGATGNWEFTAP